MFWSQTRDFHLYIIYWPFHFLLRTAKSIVDVFNFYVHNENSWGIWICDRTKLQFLFAKVLLSPFTIFQNQIKFITASTNGTTHTKKIPNEDTSLTCFQSITQTKHTINQFSWWETVAQMVSTPHFQLKGCEFELPRKQKGWKVLSSRGNKEVHFLEKVRVFFSAEFYRLLFRILPDRSGCRSGRTRKWIKKFWQPANTIYDLAIHQETEQKLDKKSTRSVITAEI